MENVERMQTPINWRMIAVVAAVALAAWYIWKRHDKRAPDVRLQQNTPAPQAVLPGVSPNVTSKMALAADKQIPVVMTSGASVPYGDDEIKQIVAQALQRVNAMDEFLTLIQVVSASKTLDSYKTVAYDIVFNAYDGRENVGLKLALSALVPASGKLYVRSFKPWSVPEKENPGPPAFGADPGGFAAYEDPVSVLSKTKVS